MAFAPPYRGFCSAPPTLSGTAGAVIQIRGRIPNRQALMDVGVYGPLAGYLASLIVIAFGFLFSRATSIHLNTHPNALVGFGNSLTLNLVHGALHPLYPATPTFALANRHPALVAGWVGLFITSLNLIPAGQLDGGHILYAILSPAWGIASLPCSCPSPSFYADSSSG